MEYCILCVVFLSSFICLFVSSVRFEGSRMIQVMLLKSLLQVNTVTLVLWVLTCLMLI